MNKQDAMARIFDEAMQEETNRKIYATVEREMEDDSLREIGRHYVALYKQTFPYLTTTLEEMESGQPLSTEVQEFIKVSPILAAVARDVQSGVSPRIAVKKSGILAVFYLKALEKYNEELS